MELFDKIGKKASETFKTTKEKTVKLTEEYKIKSTIADNKMKITELYNEIGKLVYEATVNNKQIEEQEVEERCTKINKLKNDMKDLEEKLLNLKDIVVCTGCGNKVSSKDKFCSTCGKKVEIPDSNVEVKEEPAKDATEVEVIDVSEVDE